jgi:hypothetical protein
MKFIAIMAKALERLKVVVHGCNHVWKLRYEDNGETMRKQCKRCCIVEVMCTKKGIAARERRKKKWKR